MVEPKDFFIENYVPLPNTKGEIVAVVEVYKEPRNLMAAIKTGQRSGAQNGGRPAA